MTLVQISTETGIPYKELRAKCVRIGINPDGHISEEHRHGLKNINRGGFLILPSKMNKDENRNLQSMDGF